MEEALNTEIEETEPKIVLKDMNGDDMFFEGVAAVKLNLDDGSTQIFSKGEAIAKRIALDFSNGDMIVEDEDKLFSTVKIYKPETLIPENIAKDVEIAGVVGIHESGGLIDYVNDEYECTNTVMGQYSNFKGVRSMTFHHLTSVAPECFANCSDLVKVDFYNAWYFRETIFIDCPALEAVIIRTTGMCTIQAINPYLFGASVPANLYIYVPSNLVATYKADSIWSQYADRFRAIEDYPDICG